MSTSIIVCTSPWGRLKVGNRYVWVSFHEYCGPSFYTDSAMNKLYDPKDENDPVWEQFDRWLKKYRAAKDKEQRSRNAGVAIPATGWKADKLGSSLAWPADTSTDADGVAGALETNTEGRDG